MFKKWIDPYKSDNSIKYLFHVSNPNFSLFSQIREYFNPIYEFSFHPSFINSNSYIKKLNSKYYSHLLVQNQAIIDETIHLNIDDQFNYKISNMDRYKIVDDIESGNIDEYFNIGMKYIKKIEIERLSPKQKLILAILRSLFF